MCKFIRIKDEIINVSEVQKINKEEKTDYVFEMFRKIYLIVVTYKNKHGVTEFHFDTKDEMERKFEQLTRDLGIKV